MQGSPVLLGEMFLNLDKCIHLHDYSEYAVNYLEIHCLCPHKDDLLQPRTSSAMQIMFPRYHDLQGEASLLRVLGTNVLGFWYVMKRNMK